MKTPPLYEQIVAEIREGLLAGRLRPGDPLPTVREMAERWHCTPGTVQQAYKELARQGLAVSRPGQGTRIGAEIPAAPTQAAEAPLRRAALVHQAETFLLEVTAAGYALGEIESAFRTALDRWRALVEEAPAARSRVLRFVGSHDPAVSMLTDQFGEFCTDCVLNVTYTGSLGGLIALAEDKADLAGSHLWDVESATYNEPFIRRLLPGRRVALLTLAHRRFGLLTPPGNPRRLTGITDLVQPGIRFINRQRGAGTRVWLDAHLQREHLEAAMINGYAQQASTHAEIARAIAEDRADVGLGIEAAALAYGLSFVQLGTEPYDLVIPEEAWLTPAIRSLAAWLVTPRAHALIDELGGYETTATGQVRWVA